MAERQKRKGGRPAKKPAEGAAAGVLESFSARISGEGVRSLQSFKPVARVRTGFWAQLCFKPGLDSCPVSQRPASTQRTHMQPTRPSAPHTHLAGALSGHGQEEPAHAFERGQPPRATLHSHSPPQNEPEERHGQLLEGVKGEGVDRKEQRQPQDRDRAPAAALYALAAVLLAVMLLAFMAVNFRVSCWDSA